MNGKPSVAFAMFALLAQSLCADNYSPFPATNTIALHFDSGIPEAVQNIISADYLSCLTASRTKVKLHHEDCNPSDHYRLAYFWQPYEETSDITNRLGFYLPHEGVYSNGVFTIDISYTFATNYQRQVDSTAPLAISQCNTRRIA